MLMRDGGARPTSSYQDDLSCQVRNSFRWTERHCCKLLSRYCCLVDDLALSPWYVQYFLARRHKGLREREKDNRFEGQQIGVTYDMRSDRQSNYSV